MKKIIILAVMASLLTPSISFAAMNPELKECMQRGYEVEYTQDKGHFCILPNGSKCKLEDFNTGTCGLEYKNKNYCIAEGLPVWDKDKCCPGTVPYTDKFAQATCTKLSTTQTILYQMRDNLPTVLFGGIGIIFIFVIFFIIYKKQKN